MDLRRAVTEKGFRPGRPLWAPLLVLCLGLLSLPVPGFAAIDDPTLWTKTFRAELVVRVRVLDGDNRMASVQVEEVIKGAYEREAL